MADSNKLTHAHEIATHKDLAWRVLQPTKHAIKKFQTCAVSKFGMLVFYINGKFDKMRINR
jgi:hypothetical protein